MTGNETLLVILGLCGAFFVIGMGIGTLTEKNRADRLRWPNKRHW